MDVLIRVEDVMRSRSVSIALDEDTFIVKDFGETFNCMMSWNQLVVEMPTQGGISLRFTPHAANIGEYSLTLVAMSNSTET